MMINDGFRLSFLLLIKCCWICCSCEVLFDVLVDAVVVYDTIGQSDVVAGDFLVVNVVRHWLQLLCLFVFFLFCLCGCSCRFLVGHLCVFLRYA